MIFHPFGPDARIDATKTMYPSVLSTFAGGQRSYDGAASTYYGFALSDGVTLKKNAFELRLLKGMYFAITAPFTLSGAGQLMLIERIGYRGMDQFGGPIEEHGRLVYIDDCRASVLVSPPRKGDPVLNLLTFPPGVLQTKHKHPTVRLGVVAAGRGLCHLPGQDSIPLEPGVMFLLDEGENHHFESRSESLVVIAYHPESDFGPEDENHPMLNRTYAKTDDES